MIGQRRRGWVPAFYQVEDDLPYRCRGNMVLPIGSDGLAGLGSVVGPAEVAR
jgi:hypothetical protein